MKRINVLIFWIMVSSSCVPVKKIILLQKDDLKDRKSLPKDSVVRTHTLNIKEYRIQPLDILSINFETLSDETDSFDFLKKLSPQMRTGGGGSGGVNASANNGLLVDGNGEISYAILGKIKVAGLTLFQAQDTIQSIALKYLPDVVVRVRMLNFRFTLLGEVNGDKTIVSPNTRITIMEAIGLGGGLGEFADRRNVKVIRQNGSETEVYYVDLLREEFLESPHYYVQQNDIIIVPPLKQRTFRKYFMGNLGIVTTAISFAILIITLSK